MKIPRKPILWLQSDGTKYGGRIEGEKKWDTKRKIYLYFFFLFTFSDAGHIQLSNPRPQIMPWSELTDVGSSAVTKWKGNDFD